MTASHFVFKSRFLLLTSMIPVALAGLCGLAHAQSGHVLDGVGAVDQSMAGATTALPLDAMGSIHRNSASITGLKSSEIGFGFAMFAPGTKLSSRVDAGAFGPGFPPATLAGSTSSDIDINPMPFMGIVHKSEDSPFAYGIGGFAVGGFGVDFPASPFPPAGAPAPPTNPILTPQAPNGVGFGAIYSAFQMLQISAPVAVELTDRLSVGLAPTFSWGTLAVTPFAAATPDDANADTFFTYPNGSRTDARWALGFQLGLYWEDPCSGWHFGLSYQSTQWFEEFQINSQDELGGPRGINFNLDYPAQAALGVAYTGIDCWAFSADVKYIDYAGTDGFGPASFGPTGAVTGFGWESIFVLACGAQYQVNERLSLRGGYAFNENPISSDTIFYNVFAPAIVQHHLNVGASWHTPHDWVLSCAYHHGFENTTKGPWQSPGGAIPGTEVRADLQTHTMSFQFTKKY